MVDIGLKRLLRRIKYSLLPSDIAFIGRELHPPSRNFITNVIKYTGTRIHFLDFENSFEKYRKIIVPNGFGPAYKEVMKKIPPEKRVYIEVGFFPQLKYIYFDTKGIHGYSSVRDVKLEPLTPEQRKELEEFRKFYTAHNFTKIGETFQEYSPDEGRGKYDFPFIFVPMQMENDTAYQLCPFKNNQAIISFIESCFPEWTIIFKNHPAWPAKYKIKEGNILLPTDNRDLRELLIKASYVVGVNSTVLLEALIHDKICASLGEGFSTNHNVCLECHKDRNKLKDLTNWKPAREKVDMFLYYLMQKQIHIEFWKKDREMEKLITHLKSCGII